MSDEREYLLFGCLKMQQGLDPCDLHEGAKSLLSQAAAMLYCIEESTKGDAFSEEEAGHAAMGIRSLIEAADFIYDDLHSRWIQMGKDERLVLVRGKGGAA